MDKDLRIKIKIDSETAKLDTLNSKINDTSKGFNQADSMVSTFTSKLDALNGKMKSAFDSKPIDDLVKRTLDPYGAKLDEINQKWQNNLLIMQKNGKNTSGVFSAWNKEIKDLETSKLDALNGKVNTIENSFNKTDSMVSSFTKRILMLGGAYLSLNAAINGGKSFIRQADAMHLLDARLKLATTSTAEYESQQKKLLKVSLDSYTSLSDTTTLFTKLNPALQKVGGNTGQVNSMVATFTKGLQLGGASAEESSSAILQFSQAMGSGVLRGEEFNAMAEASPKLMEYLAKGLGVPQTALRKMAEEGELTSVRVTNALLAVKTDIERDFLTMPVTVGKAMTNMSTNMSLAIKEIDEATGASTLLSNTIIDFTRNISDGSESIISFYEGSTNFINEHNQALNTTGTIVKTVAAAYLGFAVTSGIATGIGAITTSVYALRTSILVLQTSIPIIGWVAAAVGTAAGAYVLANDMMDESNYKSEISTDRLKEKIKELEDRKASLAQNKFKDSNEKTINLEIEALQSKLKLQEQLTKKQIQSTTNIIPTAEKTAVTELIGEYEGYAKTIDRITEKKKTFSELTKELQKEIDPVRAIKEEYEALRKSIKGTESDTPEYNKKINKNELEAIEKLDKEKISKAKETAKRISEIESEFSLVGLNTWDSKFKELDNKYNADLVKYKDIIGAKEKLDSIYADKINELANQRNNEIQKEDLSYYERLVQLKSDSYEKEIELANISYAQKTLDIQDLNRPIAEKEKLLSLETELYNKTLERVSIDNQISVLDEVSNSYGDMLDAQISLLDATNDWNSNLTGTAASLADIASSTTNLSKLNLTNLKNEDKLRTEYEKNKLKFYDDEEKLKQLDTKYTKDKATLDEKNLSATLIGFSNISAAVSTLFDEGSKEAAISQIAQSSLALVEGTRAILIAGTGDPYTAIPRMISMAAMVSSLFSNIGIAFGMNTTSTYSDAFSSMEANTGTGTVLGDTTAQSESITNSLSILQDFAQPQYLILNEMNSYVKSIESKIGGISSLLIQNTGYALGKGYEGFDTGYSNTYSLNNDIATAVFSGGAGLLLSKLNIPILSDITGLFGNVVNSVLGGLFGKTSVSQSLKDSGIYFADALLTSAIEQFDGDAYQTIKTTVSTKSWFSKSSSTTIKSYFKDLDEETNKQFSLVLDSLYNTVLTAGIALDNNEENTANSLANFVVSIGKISLKDKTGTQIQEELNSIFGKVGDDIAKTAFPELNDFQQIGEGLFTTMSRVATGMENADFYISRLGNRFDDVIYTAIGNKQGDVGFEALLQSIQAVEVATYPANNNLYKIVENLDATAEELYSMYTNLDELRDRLIFLKQDTQALSSSMIYGAGSVSALDDGFKAYFENFLTENEQLTYKTQQLIKEFNNLGIALPTSKDGSKDLLNGIDKTSESGQELYGRLIILSKEFAGVADSTKESIDTLTSSLEELSTNQFDTFISSIDNVGKSITSVKNTALSFLQGLNSSSNASLEDQLISYNKLRAQFAANFDSNGLIKAGANESDVSSLYSQISSLATNIAGQDDYLKNSLISQFQNDMYSFNASEDVIRVNIVDGLGSLYNLNNLQLSQLQTVAADGKITNTELSTINGLTQTQKDGILEFANNSSYFSQENTLSSVNEYMKKQLETLQQTQSNESANLSSQTFAYGDYVGKQEQIDIATKLGVSYDTAKPLIEKIQSLSISKNLSSDIQSLMGYTGTSYDTNIASQLDSLSPYLSSDIQNIIASTKDTANTNLIVEQARQESLKVATAKYNSDIQNWNTNINLAQEQANLYLTRGINSQGRSEWSKFVGLDYNQAVNQVNQNSKFWRQYMPDMTPYLDLLNKVDMAKSIPAPALSDYIRGYAVGTPNLERDQLLYGHQGEIITPRTFSDGIRNGDLVMGDNNKVVGAIEDLTLLTKQQAQEIQRMGEQIKEMNERESIKTAKGAA